MRNCLIIFSFLFITPCFATDKDSAAIILLGAQEKYSIIKQLYSYTEGATEISPQLAYRYFEAGKFRPVAKTNNQYINDGLVNKRTWFGLLLNNVSNQESSVVLNYVLSGINSVQCYTINDQQQIQPLIKSKTNYTTASDGLMAKSETFNISLMPREKIILLMHTINNGQLLYIPTRLFETSRFREYDSNKHNFFGIFQGIFFFIIVFNLLLYLTTFDKIYLLYLLYAFFISLFALNEVGTSSYTLSYLPLLNYFSGQTFLFAGFAVWLVLMLQFLNLTRNNKLLYKYTLVLSALNLLFAFLPGIAALFGWHNKSSFQQFYQSSVTLLFITNLLFIIITNTARILNGSKLAIFYAVANIPVILGAILYYTNYYNITNITFGWSNPVALGLSIETFLISFGFAYRYNLIGKQKQKLLLQVNENQHELTKQIINTQELEQKRIAEDLHDELGSNLAAIKMTLQSFHLPDKQSQILMQLIDNASTNTRNISHNLMPPDFEEIKLKDLLTYYYQRLNTDGTIKFYFHSSGSDHYFDKPIELMIYRIVMELTNNVFKHSQATEATIQLVYHEKYLDIMAEDNGKGINKNDPVGIGLKNIQSRVNYLNGKMHIDSNMNGTTVIIQLPYKIM